MSVEAHGQFLGTAAQVIPVLYLAALVDFGRPVDAATANGERNQIPNPSSAADPSAERHKLLEVYSGYPDTYDPSTYRLGDSLGTYPYSCSASVLGYYGEDMDVVHYKW
jgi:hypothetical protein